MEHFFLAALRVSPIRWRLVWRAGCHAGRVFGWSWNASPLFPAVSWVSARSRPPPPVDTPSLVARRAIVPKRCWKCLTGRIMFVPLRCRILVGSEMN